MLEKLKQIETEYDDLTNKISDTQSMSDISLYQKMLKRRANIEPIALILKRINLIESEISSLNQMLKQETDKEMKILTKEEINSLQTKRDESINEIKKLLEPKEPEEEIGNVIIEIRAGTGGEESGLFAADLFRMYNMYSQNANWKLEMISSNPTGIGGFKEIIFAIENPQAYTKLRFESGVHRVQRVPLTEASGRIHTSAASVAVLREPEEVEININNEDLRIDTYRASGAGGQYVNKTDSAIRITHLPTGLVVTCQDERSQYKNKVKAMRVLRAELLDIAQREQHAKTANERKSQIGTGDRSEKIRTYNYPQNRVTDHRIGLTLHKLEKIMDGDLEEIFEALKLASKQQALKEAN